MKYYITPEFEETIGSSRLASLNTHQGSVYGLDAGLKIAYLNPAWFRFAEENGADIFINERWSLGSNILDCIPDVLKSFYKEKYELLLDEQDNQDISIQSEYECSSAALYRRFSMHIYSMGNKGLLVVHSLVIEEPHTSLPKEARLLDEKEYTDDYNLINQCANCRRIENIRYKGRWDWVPSWVNNPRPNISHGLCLTCMRHYYNHKQ